MRKFIVKQAAYVKNRRPPLKETARLTLRKGGDYYRDVMAKVEALCYGEPRRNHTVLYEGKKPLVSIRKPDDGQMPINIRNSKS